MTCNQPQIHYVVTYVDGETSTFKLWCKLFITMTTDTCPASMLSLVNLYS